VTGIGLDRLRDAPSAVRRWCDRPGVWVCGGAARWLVGDAETVKDWDLLCVDFADYTAISEIALSHREVVNARANKWGGVSFSLRGVAYDVFHTPLAFLLSAPLHSILVHPASGAVWRRDRGAL
jgi:hypothetical protein